jgi:hypothetical protein
MENGKLNKANSLLLTLFVKTDVFHLFCSNHPLSERAKTFPFIVICLFVNMSNSHLLMEDDYSWHPYEYRDEV